MVIIKHRSWRGTLCPKPCGARNSESVLLRSEMSRCGEWSPWTFLLVGSLATVRFRRGVPPCRASRPASIWPNRVGFVPIIRLPLWTRAGAQGCLIALRTPTTSVPAGVSWTGWMADLPCRKPGGGQDRALSGHRLAREGVARQDAAPHVSTISAVSRLPVMRSSPLLGAGGAVVDLPRPAPLFARR